MAGNGAAGDSSSTDLLAPGAGIFSADGWTLFAVIRDIKPKSPVRKLSRDYPPDAMAERFGIDTIASVVGMSKAFLTRALGYPAGSRPRTIALDQVLELLDVDGYQETFVQRSRVPEYLLDAARGPYQADTLGYSGNITLLQGDARELIPRLAPASVQCVVTSSPYWGMCLYDNHRDVLWADGERCPYGFEQTPEGFIRHTTELLYLFKAGDFRHRLCLVEPDGHLQHSHAHSWKLSREATGDGRPRRVHPRLD